jgi:SRSO17 transposase
MKLERQVPQGWAAWIVARRSLGNPQKIASYHVCAPQQTTLEHIVQVAGQRWRVEEDFERAKVECGLDQYEVRSWTGWYRHITLSMLALVCATLMQRQATSDQGKKGELPELARGSLTPFKLRRGLKCS